MGYICEFIIWVYNNMKIYLFRDVFSTYLHFFIFSHFPVFVLAGTITKTTVSLRPETGPRGGGGGVGGEEDAVDTVDTVVDTVVRRRGAVLCLPVHPLVAGERGGEISVTDTLASTTTTIPCTGHRPWRESSQRIHYPTRRVPL